jgi:LysM repeat protein
MKLFFSILSFLFSISVSAQDFNSEDYIRKFHKMAIAEMHSYSIPASITLAQGILESGNGNSELALKSKNHFGIKCHKGWTGKKTYHDDDEEQECFRRYKKVSDSYRDHSEFLKNRERYAFLFKYKTSDYKSWAKGLKKAGYATHPDYATKLITLIKRYDLSQYDSASRSGKRNVKKPKRKERKEIFKSTNGLKFVLADVGDNFDVIATEQSLWLWQLLEFNDLTADGSLKTGDRVYIEFKKNKSSVEFHLVKKGETFYSISQLYGVRLAKLYHKNRVEVGAQVQVGQKVFLRKRKSRNYSAE